MRLGRIVGRLSDAAAFAGVIGGLRTGDRIDLIGVAATSLESDKAIRCT